MQRIRVKRRTPELTPRLALFGPPLLIEGEDAATYDDLLAHMLAAVKPVDVIDEMLIVDVASLEWDILRWRRLKLSLIRAWGLKALEDFLGKQLEYDLYRIHFAEEAANRSDAIRGIITHFSPLNDPLPKFARSLRSALRDL